MNILAVDDEVAVLNDFIEVVQTVFPDAKIHGEKKGKDALEFVSELKENQETTPVDVTITNIRGNFGPLNIGYNYTATWKAYFSTNLPAGLKVEVFSETEDYKELTVRISGTPTALASGCATFTSMVEPNENCTYNITERTDKVETIAVKAEGDATTVAAGSTLQMSATATPDDAADKSVTWSVSDGTKATINETTGLLTGVAAGTVTVTATAKDGSGVKGTKEITVAVAAVEHRFKSITTNAEAAKAGKFYIDGLGEDQAKQIVEEHIGNIPEEYVYVFFETDSTQTGTGKVLSYRNGAYRATRSIEYSEFERNLDSSVAAYAIVSKEKVASDVEVYYQTAGGTQLADSGNEASVWVGDEISAKDLAGYTPYMAIVNGLEFEGGTTPDSNGNSFAGSVGSPVAKVKITKANETEYPMITFVYKQAAATIPTAAISDVTVTGQVGTKISTAKFDVNITGDSFKQSYTYDNALIAGMIQNLPAGVKCTAFSTVSENDTSIRLVVSADGNLTAAKTGPIEVTIPGEMLKGGQDIVATVNANAKWNITAPNPVTIPNYTWEQVTLDNIDTFTEDTFIQNLTVAQAKAIVAQENIAFGNTTLVMFAQTGTSEYECLYYSSAGVCDSSTSKITSTEFKNHPTAYDVYIIKYKQTKYAATVTNGTGDGQYAKGETVTITADAPAIGKKFKEWTTTDGITFANSKSATTTFTMPEQAVTVVATYESDSVKACAITSITSLAQMDKIVFTNDTKEDIKAYVSANEINKSLADWYLILGPVENGLYPAMKFGGSTVKGENDFVSDWMISSLIKAGVIFVNAEAPVTKYTVTITNGTGDGQYAKGETVTITADAPAAGKKFKEWTATGGVTFADGKSATTTFIMPEQAVTVAATYENISSGSGSSGSGSSSGGGSSSDSTSVTAHWSENSTNWTYTKSDGSLARDEWQLLNYNGQMKWYHFGSDTKMDTGWLKDSTGSWYYLNANSDGQKGAMTTGWMTDPMDGKRYYLDPATGKMATGWVIIDGVEYYFNETVNQDSGWHQDTVTGEWIYDAKDITPLGAMITGKQK